VRPQTRLVDLAVSPGVDAISIDLQDGNPCGAVVVTSGRESFNGPGPHPITEGRVTISVPHASYVEASTADAVKPYSPWPMLRRALTETRDRLAPIYMPRR